MKAVDNVLLFTTFNPLKILIVIFIVSLLLFPGIIGFDRIPVLNQVDFLKGIGGLEQDNDFHGYLDPTDDVPVILDYMKEVFNSEGFSLYVAVDAPNIYDKEVIEYVYKLHTEIDKIDEDESKFEAGIKDITSIINVKDVRKINNELKSYSLIEEDEEDNKLLPKTEEELKQLKEKVESNDKYKAYIVSNNSKAWNILVALEEQKIYDDIIIAIENRLNELEDSAPKGVKIYLSGEAYNLKEINSESRKDLFIQIPLVVLVICIIYFLNFKSIRGVVFPLLLNLIAGLWTYSIIGFAGVKLSIIGLLLIPLLTAVGSSYAIHSLNQYYKESHTYSKDKKPKQISQAISHIIKTIAIAGLTTMIGLLSLATSSIIHLRTFGIFAGIGVIISVILSITFLPSLLSIASIPKYTEEKKFDDSLFDKLLEKITIFTIKRKYIVFIVMIVIIITCAIGMFRVSTASSQGNFFVKEHKVKKLLDYFGKFFDGVSTMDIVIDANPEVETSNKNEIANIKKALGNSESNNNDISNTNNTLNENNEDPFAVEDVFGNNNENMNDNSSDPFAIDDVFGDTDDKNTFDIITTDIQEDKTRRQALKSDLLKKVDELMTYAEENIEGVGRCYSYTDIQKRFNYAMHNDDPEYDKIPTQDEIYDYMELFSMASEDENNDGLPDDLENFIDPYQNKLRITLKLKNVGDRLINSDDYKRIEKVMSEYIKDKFDMDKIDFFISGNAILYKDIQERIVWGQMISIIFSLVIIAIVSIILFDSFKIGLISLIPLATAVIINFGIMAYTGIVLNIGTSLISAFTIGIGIDDTIHFMLNMKRELKHSKKKKSHKSYLKKDDYQDAEKIIYNTLRHTRKPIIFTSLALIFGFLVVIFSTFMPIRNFSILLAVTMINATIGTLIFLPSLILIFPRLIKIKKSKPLGKFSKQRTR